MMCNTRPGFYRALSGLGGTFQSERDNRVIRDRLSSVPVEDPADGAVLDHDGRSVRTFTPS